MLVIELGQEVGVLVTLSLLVFHLLQRFIRKSYSEEFRVYRLNPSFRCRMPPILRDLYNAEE